MKGCFQQRLKRRLAVKILNFAIAFSSKLEIHEDDLDSFCSQCGSKLEIVRPGKYQCPKCE